MTLRNIDQYRATTFLGINEGTYEPHETLDCWIGKFYRSAQSFNRWDYLAFLELEDTIITRPMVHSMIDLLELPLAKDPSACDNQEFRWISITLVDSRLATSDINLDYERDYCENEDISRLFSAMTSRALQIRIYGCRRFLEEFLAMGEQQDPMEVEALAISEWKELPELFYANLGDMIQHSRSLRNIELCLPFVDESLGLFEGLANAINLEELSLEDARKQDLERDDIVDDLVVGENGDYGPIVRLLQNPQNPLKRLSLKNMGLEDSHLVAVLQAISIDQIEHLEFSHNLIQVEGMLEFATLLPKMTALCEISFEHNPFQDSSTSHDKVGKALLQGVMENTSIRDMRGIKCLPQFPQLWYYLAMNRAGRRILTSSEPIADGLWPLVLEQTQDESLYDYLCVSGSIKVYNGMASAIYYFLQNCPKILSFHGL